jgi:hypothetical protein
VRHRVFSRPGQTGVTRPVGQVRIWMRSGGGWGAPPRVRPPEWSWICLASRDGDDGGSEPVSDDRAAGWANIWRVSSSRRYRPVIFVRARFPPGGADSAEAARPPRGHVRGGGRAERLRLEGLVRQLEYQSALPAALGGRPVDTAWLRAELGLGLVPGSTGLCSRARP